MKNENQIQLTEEELAIITAQREAKARAEAEAKAKAELEESRRLAAQEKREAEIAKLRDAILAEDKDDLLTESDDGKLHFLVGGKRYVLGIDAHVVYRRGYLRGDSQGYKFVLSGSFNDHRTQYYKNPKTVLKKIAEFASVAEAEHERKLEKADLKVRALELAQASYPGTEVTFEAGHDWGRGANRSYKPDTIKVKTERGHIEFSFREDKEGIHLNRWARFIGQSISEQVDALILGEQV